MSSVDLRATSEAAKDDDKFYVKNCGNVPFMKRPIRWLVRGSYHVCDEVKDYEVGKRRLNRYE